jgi:molybdopterin-containing oxidoreductase family iron-sulfur binding subunit
MFRVSPLMKDQVEIPDLDGSDSERERRIRELLTRAYPEGEAPDPLSRRNFLKLASASLALAGLAGCRRPVEKIVPYLSAPEEVVLGVPNYYATTMPFGLDAYGLIVESHEGRPTKVEGNPEHPSTLGGSNSMIQAAILELYDPDRSRQIMNSGSVSSWAEFVEFWRTLESGFASSGGEGLALLSESFSSPTLSRLRKELTARYPRLRWVTYEPVSDENLYEGIRWICGETMHPLYHFDQASVIVSLDSDFLFTESGGIAGARKFTAGRNPAGKTRKERIGGMNRLYAIESLFTLTGAAADHRLALRSSRIGHFALALAAELQKRGLSLQIGALSDVSLPSSEAHFLTALADDLIENAGGCLIVAGRRQPPAVHALALVINSALGNLGKTVTFSELRDAAIPDRNDLKTLTEQMKRGEISSLIILGGNPVYDAPADLDFAAALKRVKHSIHLSLYRNETSQETTWHLHRAHFLECWGDARALDGALSVIQPLIEPLYGGHSPFELLNLMATGEDRRGYEVVRDTWRILLPTAGFETLWRQILNDGIWKDGGQSSTTAKLDPTALSVHLKGDPFPHSSGIELLFTPDPRIWDGRFANNGWLQESPDPVTKITWDNVALISPAFASELNISDGDRLRLRSGGREVVIPAWVQPGLADGTVAVALGYGRKCAGGTGDGVGTNVYPLRTVGSFDLLCEIVVERAGGANRLAVTQKQRSMMGRPLIREAKLTEYRKNPAFAREMVEVPPLQSLWKEHEYRSGYQWGMVIDLNRCIGCQACVTACQAENNIPIVGKERVIQGRIMHWIRVDGYWSEEGASMRLAFQPIPCQHCEMAPCENVCPVAATVHDKEGLNLMTYNRCVGTRYCSNNCPYKVRRFNFFHYTDKYPETLKMAQNPDVTVRSRGVMEKCTYCLQRINRAKIRANQEMREVQDGEILTACQQACPTGAITFGNINTQSMVRLLKENPLNYEILAEFNTRPRTSYLAKVRNPKPELEA